MKKFLTFGLLVLSIIGLMTSPVFSQDAKDILNKMIEASGGRKAMEAIKDTTFTGTMKIVQIGLSGTVTFYHKEPNMLRQDIEVMDMVITMAFDGEVAWRVNPETGATEELPAEAQVDAKHEALGFGNAWMLYPEKFGITFADKGTETIEGKEYIVLEQAFEDGSTSTYYIDPGTYLTLRMKTTTIDPMGMEVEQETVLSDYKKVDGIMFAHSIIIYQYGEEFGSMMVEQVMFNTGLEDSLFKKQ